MIVTIGGDIGSGKTTVAKALAERFHIENISAGEAFRAMAQERGMSLAEFSKLAEEDHTLDRELDKKQVQLVKAAKDVVVDGRLSGLLLQSEADLKIWLRAPLEVRAKRVSGREKKDFRQVLEETREREESELKRYKEIYQIDLRDLSPYDVILNTELWGSEEIINIIGNMISLLSKGAGSHGCR
ncbi:MAG: AAA family ATPase [Candidatus Hydrothermarchaeales archaeon]